MQSRRERVTVRYRIPAGSLKAFRSGIWPCRGVTVCVVERDGIETPFEPMDETIWGSGSPKEVGRDLRDPRLTVFEDRDASIGQRRP